MDYRNRVISDQFALSAKIVRATYERLAEAHPQDTRWAQILHLIDDLQGQQPSCPFRLGTSIYYLILSRALDHGLRDDQKRIVITTDEFPLFKVYLRDGSTIFRKYTVASLDDPRVQAALAMLARVWVD